MVPQSTLQWPLTHPCTHTFTPASFGAIRGFSVLPKETSTCSHLEAACQPFNHQVAARSTTLLCLFQMFVKDFLWGKWLIRLKIKNSVCIFQIMIQAQDSVSVALQIQQLESQVMDAEKRAFTAEQQVGFFFTTVCVCVHLSVYLSVHMQSVAHTFSSVNTCVKSTPASEHS